MRYLLVPFMALALFNSPLLADHKGKCTCDKKCEANCKAGHGEKCKCEACDCSKTGKCDPGKCEHHDEAGHKHEEGKKDEKKK